jgi:hypothetical protein
MPGSVSASDPGGASNRPHLQIMNCGVPFKDRDGFEHLTVARGAVFDQGSPFSPMIGR